MANSLPSTEVTAVASSGAVRVTWTAVPHASDYQVYARTPAGTTSSWTVTVPTFVHSSPTGGRAGAPPSAATNWQVKNLLELKNARRVRVEYNLFENNWQAAQAGYAILFTVRNQGGKCTWCVVEQVTFSHNVIRNVAGGFNITGYDSEATSQQSNTITIQDNFLYGVTTVLGGTAWAFLVGEAVRNLTIDHNTIDSDGTTVLYAYGGTSTAPKPMPGFTFTNNAARHGTYGINGANASTGSLTFQMYFPSAIFAGNWLSGGSSSQYPPGNRFEEPFDMKLPTGPGSATSAPETGANLRVLLSIIENVVRGVGVRVPDPPGGVRVVQ